jgi:Na+/proline symporter
MDGVHFNWVVDGSIVGLYLLFTMAIGVYVRKYVGKVEDFLVAGREMNIYLGIASLAATEFGIITCMYTAQSGYENGFAGAFPGIAQCLAMLLIGLTGFCIKPLRDSGAITIPELFEKKFGANIRWLAGVVIVMGGLLNMGVFLKIGGDFLVIVTDMNSGTYDFLGLHLTNLQIVMGLLLVAVCVYTMLGGMVSVLITDFLQFIVMSIGLLVVTFFILKQIGWCNLAETVRTTHGAGGFNPFVNKNLGIQFVIFQLIIQTAATLTWQTCISRVLAAKDSATGRKVYTRTSFFFVARFLIPGIWGIAALYLLAQPLHIKDLQALRSYELSEMERKAGGAEKFGLSAERKAILIEKSSAIRKELSAKKKSGTIEKSEGSLLAAAEQIEQDISLHAMPKLLSIILPIGIMGLLIAAMLAADMSTDSSYMLTWASVIFNDILAPFRRKSKMSDKKGILINRCIVAVIGVYLLIFGLFYEIKGSVWDYLTLTGSIYLSSMSVLLIACCYWKKANNWGASGAIVLGALIPCAYLSMQKIPATQEVAGQIGPYYSGIATYVFAALGMIVGSLIKPDALSEESRQEKRTV